MMYSSHMPSDPFDPWGRAGVRPPPLNPGGMSIPGVQPLGPMGGGHGGGQLGGQGGGGPLGFLGELGPMEKAYLLSAGVGGIADFFERRSERQEEKRRYEEAMEERRRHRRNMGQSLSAAWGP